MKDDWRGKYGAPVIGGERETYEAPVMTAG